MNTLSITRIWIARFNPFSLPLGYPPDHMSNIGFHAPPQHPGFAQMAPRETPAIAAPHGMLIQRLQPLLPGARKLLRKTRTPMRFASALCTTSGSTLTQPPNLTHAAANVMAFVQDGSSPILRFTVHGSCPRRRTARHRPTATATATATASHLRYPPHPPTPTAYSYPNRDDAAYSHTPAESDPKGTPNAASASVRRVSQLPAAALECGALLGGTRCPQRVGKSYCGYAA